MFVSAIDAVDRAVRRCDERRDRRRSPSPARDGSSSCTTSPCPSRASARGSPTSTSSGPTAVSNTPVKKSPRRNRPLAARAADDQLAVEREDHRGQVRRRIAVGERAADRSAVAHLRVADLAGRVRDDRAVLPQERRPRRHPRGASARRSRSWSPSSRTYERSASRPTSTSSAGRAMRSFIAGRSECPPARSFASSRSPSSSIACSTMLGDLVVERCGDHDLASSIACQTRSGVAGIWMSVTPRCESASTTALMTAGAAAIVPGLPHALHAERVVGRGLGSVDLVRRQLRRRRHEVGRHRRREQVAVLVVRASS